MTTRSRLGQAPASRSTTPDLGRGQFATTLSGMGKPLNLGWLLLDRQAGAVNVTASTRSEEYSQLG